MKYQKVIYLQRIKTKGNNNKRIDEQNGNNNQIHKDAWSRQ